MHLLQAQPGRGGRREAFKISGMYRIPAMGKREVVLVNRSSTIAVRLKDVDYAAALHHGVRKHGGVRLKNRWCQFDDHVLDCVTRRIALPAYAAPIAHRQQVIL